MPDINSLARNQEKPSYKDGALDPLILVIWGEDDPWTPIAGAAIYQQHRESGPDVEFVAIANAGHCPHDEKPDAVNPLILKWLGVHHNQELD